MSKLDQKSFKCLPEVRLKADVLLQNLVDKVRLIKLELRKMRKINLHRSLLVLLDLFSLVNVEADRSLVFVAVRVVLVVRVFLAQREPVDKSQSRHFGVTYLWRKLRNSAQIRRPISSLYLSKTLL